MQYPLKNIFNLFFPELCLICNRLLIVSDQLICVSCRSNLPITNFCDWSPNEVEKSFYGRVDIISGTSLLYFNRKGNVQKLIHQLKYKKQQKIGLFLGNWLGQAMINSERFKELDGIIPVPLHKNKLKKRGYNQVTTFGISLSKTLKIPLFENVLIRVSKTQTQTLKNRFDRSKNLNEKFELIDTERFKSKHILLIDDIITTGATLEACCMQLYFTDNIKISIATMAYTL
ncbi:MAG: ComF family protein [Flavobacteriaceae bacterium]|nr:ComF family protein [Flavobacteriaceae bacterium]